ncbi:TonB-dependent receptor plug domain-containing protein [Sphingorhabdus sp.]|uniref:TonB-dependent receptor plug domain-containing protein n=1 Tax=Sphingorhabdus sp. TaxID=1902408 RepID=UPI00391B8807
MISFLVRTSALAIAVGTPAAYAQADASEPLIVVTGKGLDQTKGDPAYGSVEIDRARLISEASGRIENVLADVAGFQQFRRSDSRSANPSAQGATLRALGGNASSRTLILLDGVPQADPFFGYIPFSAIAPERLSSVRVTRGGGNGAFGAGAVAGTIELNSAGRSDLPDASLSAFYGSNNSTELSAGLATDLGAGFVSLSGRWDRSDGFFTTPATTRQPSDVRAAYDSWSTGLRAVAPLADGVEMQFRGLLFQDNRTLRFAGADSSSAGQDASIRIVSQGQWQVDALAYVQARNFTNVVISATSLRKTLDQRNTPSTGLGGKIEIRPPVGIDHQLRIGADARLSEGELFEDAYSQVTGLVTARRNAGGNTATLGVFAENDWNVGALTLTGGIRADRWTLDNGFFAERSANGTVIRDDNFADRAGWETSARVGALYAAGNGFALRAAAYTGFRLPTLNELYRPFTVFPVATRANAALEVENLRGVEAGFDLRPTNGVSFGATVFYNRLNDAIANITIGNNLRQRGNVDAIIVKGVELSGEAAFGEVAISGSYAFSDSKVRASGSAIGLNGLSPAQSPRHAANATVRWTPSTGAVFSATARYVGAQFEDDLESNILPSAVTLDGFAQIPLNKQVALTGRVENILNEAVVTRKVGTSIDLGTPRILWIGLKFTTR